MEAALGMRALKDLFGFPFQDEKKGIKFLIGSLIFISGFFIPVLPWIALWGYAARIARNSIEGQAAHLPEWVDWNNLLLDGLKLFLANLLLSLPSILIFLFGFGAYFGSTFGAILTEEVVGNRAAAPFFMLMMFSIFFMFFAMTVGTLLSIVAWFLMAPVGAHVAATGRLGSIFEVGQWGRLLRANLGGFTLVFFILFGLWALQYLVFYLLYMTMILCMFIPIAIAPITVYLLAITAFMAGQAYQEARDKLNPPATPLADLTAA